MRSIIALIVLVFASVSHASVILGTTRVILKSSDKEATVQIRNPDKLAKLIQAWVDDGDKNKSPELIDTPFQVLPPVFRINGGKGQVLRVLALPNGLPKDRESVFWLNVLEAPPKPESAEGVNYIQFALRNRIKLFYRPVGLEGRASAAGEKLEWFIRGENLIVKNPTPYHVSLSSAEIFQAKKEGVKGFLVNMVSPLSEYSISIKGIEISPKQVVDYTYLDDLGATRKSSKVIMRE